MNMLPIDAFGDQVASFEGMLENIMEERKNKKFREKKRRDLKKKHRQEPSPEISPPEEVKVEEEEVLEKVRSRSPSIASQKSTVSSLSHKSTVSSLSGGKIEESSVAEETKREKESEREVRKERVKEEEEEKIPSFQTQTSPLSELGPIDWLRMKLESYGISETIIKYGAMPFAIFVSVLLKLIFYFATRSQKVVKVRAITKNSNACVLIDEENKHYHFEEDTVLKWFRIQTMNRTLWRDIHEGRSYKLYLSGGSFVQSIEAL